MRDRLAERPEVEKVVNQLTMMADELQRSDEPHTSVLGRALVCGRE